MGDKGLLLIDPIKYEESGILEVTALALPAAIPKWPLNKPIIQYWREKFN